MRKLVKWFPLLALLILGVTGMMVMGTLEHRPISFLACAAAGVFVVAASIFWGNYIMVLVAGAIVGAGLWFLESTSTARYGTNYWMWICATYLLGMGVASIIMGVMRREKNDLQARIFHRASELEGLLERQESIELRLRETSERFSQLADNIEGVFYLMEPGQERMLYVSPAYEKIWGRKSETLFRSIREWINAIHPEDREKYQKALAERKVNGGSEIEYRIQRLNGETRRIRDRAFPIRNAAGAIVRLAGLVEDITEWRYIEESARDKDLRLRAIVNNTPLILFSFDVEGKLTFAEGQAADKIGISPIQSMFQPYNRLFAEGPAIITAIQRALRGEESEIVAPIRSFFLHCYVNPLRDENGVITGMIGVATDVTARERAERRLSAHHALSQVIAEAPGLKEAGDRLLPLLCERLGWNAGTFWIGDQSSASWACLSSWYEGGEGAEAFRSMNITSMATSAGAWSSEIWEGGRSIWRSAFQQTCDSLREHQAREVGFQSAVFCPVRAGDQYLGIIELYGRKPRPVEPDLLSVFDGVGGQIGQLIARRRAEDYLHTQAHIFESMAEGVLLIDEQGQIAMTNPAADEMFGYEPGELLSNSIAVLSKMSEREGVMMATQLKETLDAFGSWQGEFECRRKDGGTLFAVGRISRFDGAGRRWYVGVIQDVTERKRAEEALRTQALMLESMSEGVILTDEASVIVLTNPAAERTFGYGRGELIGRPIWLLSAQPQEQARREVDRIFAELRARGHWRGQWRNRRKEGAEFIAETRIGTLRIGERTFYLAVADDVTDRIRLERQILEISDREQARIGQELHDGLCQQLVSAAFAVNSLERRLSSRHLPESDEVGAVSGLLDNSINEARQLARGLYPVRVESNGLNPAIEELASTTRSRHGIECFMESVSPVSIGDRVAATHIYRIAQEAVSNAVKHSGARRIWIRLNRQGGNVELIVEDDGMGIPDSRPRGDGMGLQIMDYRAKMLGGSVRVDRRPAGGTMIVCNIPLANP